MVVKFNEKEVGKCYEFLQHKEETEIRLIDPKRKKKPFSIFVDSMKDFIENCREYNGQYNLYAGINERTKGGTGKKDVTSVQTIVIDIDAKKEKGFEKQPATNEELEGAKTICDKIIENIKKTKQPIPSILHSGNGYQIWFAIPEITIDDVNRNSIEDKIQLFHDVIIERFDVGGVIDKIGDLPRIIKIWGTLNIKGDESENRPYRVAKLLDDGYRIENEILKEQILELREESYGDFETEGIKEINIDKLPPCIEYLTKFYENKDGSFWYRITQFLTSFYMSIGLEKEKTKSLVLQWNKKQPHHESGEEKELISTIERIYRNKINISNCKKIQKERSGFPFFGLADLKICKPDSQCNKCINPVICWKRKNKGEKQPIQDAAAFFDNKIELAKKFILKQPIHYDKSSLWWIWDYDLNCWDITDEVDLTNKIYEQINIDTSNTHKRMEMLQALKQAGRLNKLNIKERTWVQFKDRIINIANGSNVEAAPDYFITNPVPWEIGGSEETPEMDKIFIEWVGEDYVQTLYEIIAYSLLPDYPIHRIFCFIGEGLNGKGCFLRLLKRFIGEKNITSTELDTLISSRFEITKLHKKLVCTMGETDFNEIHKTSTLKSLTGQDLIGFEYKNKNPFDDVNYAKILISTNNLPATSDKTIGFYRRWCLIDFPNRFTEEIDVLDRIPEIEYNNLAKKSIRILQELLQKKVFHNEGTVEERAKKYEDKSNPFDKFWTDNIKEDFDEHISKKDFKKKLDTWCKENRFRILSERTISKYMKERNIQDSKVTGEWYEGSGDKPRYMAWLNITWV